MSLPNSPLTVFNFGDIVIYSPRWQCMVMLFAALSQVRGGMTKADTIAFIRDQRWFDIQPEDMAAHSLIRKQPMKRALASTMSTFTPRLRKIEAYSQPTTPAP